MKNKVFIIMLSLTLVISIGLNAIQFKKNFELSKDVNVLENRNDELENMNNELENVNNELAEKNTEVENERAELVAQVEVLSEENRQLQHEAEVLTKEELIEVLGISEETHYHVDAICEEYYTLLESPYDSSPEEALQLTRHYAETSIKKEVVADNDTPSGGGGTLSSGTSTGGESTGTGSESIDSIEGAPSQVGSNTNTSNVISENPDYLMSDEEAQALMDQINGGSISQGTPASQEEKEAAAQVQLRGN